MVRVVVCASVLFAFTSLVGCLGHDASVDDNNGASNQKLQTKKDGTATGNGTTCSWENTTTYDTCSSPETKIPTYSLGDEFKSIDGCNECACTAKGIMCTVRVCDLPVAPTEPNPGGGVCTADAKKCPDGTWGSRGGANCEFDCGGGSPPPIACDASARICKDGSPAKPLPGTCDQICPEDPPANDPPVACTDDAMKCPDGSYVGRTGPKCEFICKK